MAAPASLDAWRAQVASFAAVGAYGTRLGWTVVSGGDEPRALKTAWVTGNFLDVLGVAVLRGRTFHDEETWSDAAPVVIVSDEYRARRFGPGVDVIGRTITVDDAQRTIVGVLPAGLSFPESGIALWLPLGWDRRPWARRGSGRTAS